MTHSDDFLFSVNSYLAYKINQEYYCGVHYVWCASAFNDPDAPASSNPSEIMRNYQKSVRSEDVHSLIINQNKIGILRGIDAKRDCETITSDQRDELINIVAGAQIAYFRPMLYVVNRQQIGDRLERVPLERRAAPFSKEYIVSDLLAREFTIIDSKDVGI